MDKFEKIGAAIGLGFVVTVMGFAVYVLVKLAILLG